jgi:hypothetical protein
MTTVFDGQELETIQAAITDTEALQSDADRFARLALLVPASQRA